LKINFEDDENIKKYLLNIKEESMNVKDMDFI
jgi:hypothetical protein